MAKQSQPCVGQETWKSLRESYEYRATPRDCAVSQHLLQLSVGFGRSELQRRIGGIGCRQGYLPREARQAFGARCIGSSHNYGRGKRPRPGKFPENVDRMPAGKPVNQCVCQRFDLHLPLRQPRGRKRCQGFRAQPGLHAGIAHFLWLIRQAQSWFTKGSEDVRVATNYPRILRSIIVWRHRPRWKKRIEKLVVERSVG